METTRECPNCGSSDIERVRFTWWGGLLGPWLLKYVQCTGCGRKFSTLTGTSGFWLKVSYIVAVTGCVLALGFLLSLAAVIYVLKFSGN